jgi:hypothetical protein
VYIYFEIILFVLFIYYIKNYKPLFDMVELLNHCYAVGKCSRCLTIDGKFYKCQHKGCEKYIPLKRSVFQRSDNDQINYRE